MGSGNFAIVGAVAGGIIGASGGPLGALKGAQMGATIGSFLDAMTAQDQFKGGDARWSGTTYGTAIPRLWGRGRTDAAIEWALRNTDGTYTFPVDESSAKKQDVSHAHGSFACLVGQVGYWFPDGTSRVYTPVVDRIRAMDKIIYQSATAQPIGAWSSGTTYAYGDYVTKSGTTYFSIADANVNHDPAVQPSNWWQPATISQNFPTITFHPGPSESALTQAVDTFIATHDGTANTSAYRGCAYFVVQDMDLLDIGNALPGSVSVEWHLVETVTVEDVLADVCRMVGLTSSDYDFSAATAVVTGFMASGQATGQDMVNQLLLAYSYDLVQVDGILKAVARGGASAVTIPTTDLSAVLDGGEHPDRINEKILADKSELHNQVEVVYRNQLANFRQASEIATRNSASGAPNSLQVSTSLTLVPDDAAKMAGRLLDTEWLEGGASYEVCVPGSYAYLCPSDIVTLTYGGIQTRFRVDKTEYVPGLIKLTLSRDEIQVLTRYETGDGGLSPVPVLATIIPTSFMVASPSHDFTDAFALSPGFYVWANGPYRWGGCTAYYTWDAPGGTRNWVKGPVIDKPCAFGVTTSALPDPTGSEVSVNATPAVAGAMLVATRTVSEMERGDNWALIGSEICAVDGELAIGSVLAGLKVFLRGLRGTTAAGHGSSEAWALAPDLSYLTKVPVDGSEVGQTVYVRCLSFGQSLADATEHSCVIGGNTAPYVLNSAPVDPSAISAGTASYNASSEVVVFTAAFSSTPPAGQKLSWQYSTNAGSTWSSSALGDSSFTPPAFTSGTMRVRAQAVVTDGRTGSWVSSSDVTYSAAPFLQPGSPVDPVSVSAGVPGYGGSTEYILFSVAPGASPPAGQLYNWEYSTDGGSTWSALALGGNTFASPGFTSGSMKARAQAVTQTGVAGNWVASATQTYAAPATGVTNSPIFGETPGGAQDGANTTFTLANTPLSGSVQLYRNGQMQQPGGGKDYTISGSTLTLSAAPASDEWLTANYWH